jgi:hypothetical protein
MYYTVTNHPKYPYKLTQDCVFVTGIAGISIKHSYFELALDGKLTVKAGYAWNGCSGVPKFKWTQWLVRCLLRGSLPHDVLYQAMQLGLLPKSFKPLIDKLMLAIWRVDACFAPMAYTGYWLVTIFGGLYL